MSFWKGAVHSTDPPETVSALRGGGKVNVALLPHPDLIPQRTLVSPTPYKTSSAVYQSGRIYGMDVSSGAAVAALLLDDYDVNTSGDRDHGGRSERRR